MLKQHLVQKQKLKITQQNILLFKLIELNSQQIEERIKEELESNPALEQNLNEPYENQSIDSSNRTAVFENDFINDIGNTEYNDLTENESYSDSELDSSFESDESSPISEYQEKQYNYNDYDYNYEDEERDLIIPVVDNSSIIANLTSQFKFYTNDEKLLQIGQYIIGNIDEDGYLRRTTQQLVDELSFRQNIITDEQEVESVVKLIQQLDPPGLAARNLQECIILQLKQLDDPNNLVKKAILILNEYFDEYSKKKFTWLAKKLKTDVDTIQQIHKLIISQNPKPLTENDNSKLGKYLVPDFLLYKENGQLKLELHSYNMPKLEINPDFVEMLKRIHDIKKGSSDDETKKFVKDKILSAQTFITTIKQRQETMIVIMKGIIDYQKEFFMTGNEANLKPMALKHISKTTGYDVSTISRVSNSKYIQTEYGIYSLKYFFSDGLENIEGDEVSTRSIKQAIRDIVENESIYSPYTDEEIVEKLKELGYIIARRTVSKYREQLGIPPRHLRKIS